MKIDDYEFVCTLDIHKKLLKNDKILYGYFDKCDCVYANSGWFYKSLNDINELFSICKSSISRSKQRMIYYGLIKIRKYYNKNGHRGIDYIHVNTLSEILEHLKLDSNTIKDQNRIENRLNYLKATIN